MPCATSAYPVQQQVRSLPALHDDRRGRSFGASVLYQNENSMGKGAVVGETGINAGEGFYRYQ